MRKLLLFALLCFWQLGLGAENDPPSQATDQQDSNPESLLEGDELIAAEVTEADEDEADLLRSFYSNGANFAGLGCFISRRYLDSQNK